MQSKTPAKIRKNILPTKIIITSIVTAIVGIVGIILLLIQINAISKEYNEMISNDYSNLEYMNEISQNLYKHQSLMYKYMNTPDAGKRSKIKAETEELKLSIDNTLIAFGYSMKGNAYESLYHNIYSSTTGYFYDINQVFSFHEAGDINTAQYYIDHAMELCISSVNDSIDKLSDISRNDMSDSLSHLFVRLSISRILSIVGVLVIIGFAFISIIYSAKTADDMVSIDSLTGVYNYDKLLRFAFKMERKGRLQEYTVISLNIRDFKLINQKNGSSVGDLVLKELAEYLEPLMSRNELVSRSGGDNFILLVKSPNTDRLINSISNITVSIDNDGNQFDIPIKIRCGIYDITFGDNIYTALNNASIALNKSKNETADSTVYFNEKMVMEMVEEKETLSMFADAIKNEEFQVYYQPKVDMPTGKLCGAEALVRWIKDDKIIPPYKFIPILEKDGAITELDMYVFEHVCQDIARWSKEGISLVKISSNFSKLHLKNKSFAENIMEIVDKYKVSTNSIEAELTESSGYEDFDALQSFISKMKASNISTSIDDFGTGYSSLSMLQELDVDVVKLDKSFIDHIGDEDDYKTRKMVENVVHLVNDLQRHVICEGVETDIQANFLVKSGCRTAQGYLYNKPLTKAEFELKLKAPQYELVID